MSVEITTQGSGIVDIEQTLAAMQSEMDELRAEVLDLRDAVTRRDELLERFTESMAASAGYVQAQAEGLLPDFRKLRS